MYEIQKLENEINELKAIIDSLEIENRRLNDYVDLKNTRNAGRKKRFSEEVVNKIKELHINDKLSLKEIQERLKNDDGVIISISTIYRITRREKHEKIKEEDIDYAVETLIEMFDEINEAIYTLDSPIPKNYDELIQYNFPDWNFEYIVKLVNVRYLTLESFLKENEIIIKQPLSHFFNIERFI